MVPPVKVGGVPLAAVNGTAVARFVMVLQVGAAATRSGRGAHAVAPPAPLPAPLPPWPVAPPVPVVVAPPVPDGVPPELPHPPLQAPQASARKRTRGERAEAVMGGRITLMRAASIGSEDD